MTEVHGNFDLTIWVNMPRWDRHFTSLAHFVRLWSKDRTKVGAVLVGTDKRNVSLGFNGPPPGVDDDVILSRRDKNLFIIHAERNAIDNAHFPTAGGTLYTTKPVCCDCAKAIIAAGVTRVVMPEIEADSSWTENQSAAFDFMMTAGVDVTFYRM
jgi:dCMP deaminase